DSNNAVSYGGGFFVQGSPNIAVSSARVSSNTAGLAGGGLLVDSTPTNIFLALIARNTVTVSSRTGGGVYALSSSARMPLRIEDTFVEENDAPASGGGLTVSGLVDTTIVQATFDTNHSTVGGGAFVNPTGLASSVVSSSAFLDNVGTTGGALF